MLASVSENTLKQYTVSYKLWWSYCAEHSIDVFEPTIPIIMAFLSDLFHKGASYGSVNSHRSALSLLLGNNVGSDERIKRLLKGMYRQKPSCPKYSRTWDPQIVLSKICNWYPNRELSLEKISKKLSVLLALCTAHRVQTLAFIRVSNIDRSSTGLNIHISDIIKTSAPGREQPLLFLPYFVENLGICPATTLNDYLSMTTELRPNSTDKLFITFKRPHKNATSQTISRWIRQTLAECGVDVNVFGAHSTRHASTSTAAAAGVSIDIIRKTAGWTNSSLTFAKFYNRPIQATDEGVFARSFLSRPKSL